MQTRAWLRSSYGLCPATRGARGPGAPDFRRRTGPGSSRSSRPLQTPADSRPQAPTHRRSAGTARRRRRSRRADLPLSRHRRWLRSICLAQRVAMPRPPRPATQRSGRAGAQASRRSSSPTAPRATATIATIRRSDQWPADPAQSTSPARTSSAPHPGCGGRNSRDRAGLQSSWPLWSTSDGTATPPRRAHPPSRTPQSPTGPPGGRARPCGSSKEHVVAPEWPDTVIDRGSRVRRGLQPLARALPDGRLERIHSKLAPTTPRQEERQDADRRRTGRASIGSSTGGQPRPVRLLHLPLPPRLEGFLPGLLLPAAAAYAYIGSAAACRVLAPAPPLPRHQRVRPNALIPRGRAPGHPDRAPRAGRRRRRGVIGPGSRYARRAATHEPRWGWTSARSAGSDSAARTDLLQLQTVITRRRERISADGGAQPESATAATTYGSPRARTWLLRAAVVDGDGDDRWHQLTYGDGAELRVTNLPRNRAPRTSTASARPRQGWLSRQGGRSTP